MDKPLLVIEVQDLNSVPVVRYKGEEIKWKSHIEYLWHTKTEVDDGLHEYKLEHVYKQSDDEVPKVRTVIGNRIKPSEDIIFNVFKADQDQDQSKVGMKMHHVRNVVQERLDKLHNIKESIKNNIDHLINETKEEELRLLSINKEMEQLENFLNGSNDEG